MSKWQEHRLLVKISKMYYEQEMTQNQISKELGIYRTTISRMLKKAKKEGIVTITINSDFKEVYELEENLESKYGLKEVIVVPSLDEGEKAIKQKLGLATAEFLKRIVKDSHTLGFAWGTTLANVANELTECDKKDIHVVPLVGGPGAVDADYHVNSIVYKTAQAFQGKAHFIDASAIVKKKDTKLETENSPHFEKILNHWNNLDIAVLGIGAQLKSSNLIWTGFFGNEEIEELDKENAIGDICSRFFDSKGHVIHSDLAERTIAIKLEQLKTLPYSIGVAESPEKVPSIIGALKGQFINVLVTDETTANLLID
ncbi:sugar-binding transcriptional regulator [Salipaludibacillus sp. CUR1]|uniref:sugar-binding transcriptional regulator n=1 Tax=Salipaludibacillus sp. CUR1 TaxID=2820003 RepID=UPI001E32DD7A|nr:sugar-binding transcriptional regulator [Salipaludibacillus sp. CUR1]MCE7792924.1 sugar-binding transcriptional regulator [Salipaludibacillus sp. CUR1]